MKKMLPILLCLSILSILFVSYYYSNKCTIPSEDISNVLSMLSEDTSGIAWPNQISINLDSPHQTYGVELDRSNIIITKGGNYILSGALPNGSVTVNTDDKVNLTLNNASITNLSGPALNIQKSVETYVTVMSNTANYLTAGATYGLSSNLTGTIISNGPLIFQGNGSLDIISSSENGIETAAPVSIRSGSLKITAAKSGILTQNKVELLGGHLYLSATGNGIDTADKLIINDGGIDLTAAHAALYSAKELIINGGTLNISNSLIGIDSASDIIINNGNINTAASQTGMLSSQNIIINNGNLHISSEKHALMSSESIMINNGTVLALVSPSHEALSCLNNELVINGGTLIALGSHGILPNAEMSQQASILLGSGDARSPVNISQDNNSILTFIPEQAYDCLLFSSPQLSENITYTLNSGGTIDKAENFYGLYRSSSSVNSKLIGFFKLTGQLTDLTAEFPTLLY